MPGLLSLRMPRKTRAVAPPAAGKGLGGRVIARHAFSTFPGAKRHFDRLSRVYRDGVGASGRYDLIRPPLAATI
jgi:hypothetical protein